MFRINRVVRRLAAFTLLRFGLAFAAVLLLAVPALAAGGNHGFGFNGSASGFPTGAVNLTGGGAYNPTTVFVHSAGGFRCTADVSQGPLSMSINSNDPGKCLAGQGVRWDTAELLSTTGFKCTATGPTNTATTDAHTVVLQADFYRAGDGNDESFTAQMIVSDHDLPGNPGKNLWVQGVGCGSAIAHFSS